MANTYVWKIADLNRDLGDGFAHTAHWTVVAISDQVDADNQPYNSGAYGSIGLDRPDTLVDFEDLTEADIVAAVQAKLGGAERVTEIQNALAARIVEQITPTQASGKPSSW
mgnify:CR=1 FL=1|jgi:hypothetical protein|tara:strand:- start:150 stop:482 length:333 start_codon:yes stop_codon:yes gene_type:complete